LGQIQKDPRCYCTRADGCSVETDG
jgi:hypothetical protein